MQTAGAPFRRDAHKGAQGARGPLDETTRLSNSRYARRERCPANFTARLREYDHPREVAIRVHHPSRGARRAGSGTAGWRPRLRSSETRPGDADERRATAERYVRAPSLT